MTQHLIESVDLDFRSISGVSRFLAIGECARGGRHEVRKTAEADPIQSSEKSHASKPIYASYSTLPQRSSVPACDVNESRVVVHTPLQFGI